MMPRRPSSGRPPINLRSSRSLVLKGAKPGDLPVEAPAQFDFIVNQQTAREIGVHIAPAALLRATKVVE